MSRLPIPRPARLVLIAQGASALGTGLVLPFLFIYLSQRRGLPVGQVGLVIAMIGVAGVITMPIAGTLIDTFGPRVVLIACTGGQAVANALLVRVTTIPEALAVAFLLGLSGAGTWPANAALLARAVPEAQRQRVFAVNFATLNAGIGVGGTLAGVVVDLHHTWTFSAIYLGNAASFVVQGLIVWLLLPGFGAPLTTAETPTNRGGYRDLLADRVFLRFSGLMTLLVTIGYGQFESGFPAFATRVGRVSTHVIGFAFAANTLVIVLGQMVVLTWVAGRRNTRVLAMVGAVWALTWAVFAVAALPGASGGPVAIVAVIAAACVFAVGEALLSPVAPTMVNALAPDHLRGRYNAANALTWNLGQILGPIFAGAFLAAHWSAAYVSLLAGGAVLAAVFASRLRRHLTDSQDGLPAATLRGERGATEPSTDGEAAAVSARLGS